MKNLLESSGRSLAFKKTLGQWIEDAIEEKIEREETAEAVK